MRKISKSRAEDDVISSTNGSRSVGNHEENDQQESENLTDENEKDPIDIADEKVSDSDSSQSPKKTPKGKAKGKKRKSERASKKEAVEDENEEEYEVEKVIDSKKIKGKLHYLIRWKGYSADSDTWEPENTLSCPELIHKFNESQKENSKGKANNSPKKRKAAPKSKGAAITKRARKSDTDDENEDENAEYEVERILEVHHKKNGEREFYIHWKGWSTKYDSWEPESNLNCPELIKKFMSKVSAARSTGSRNLRVAPETTNRFTLQDPAGGRRLSKRRGQRQRVRYDNAE